MATSHRVSLREVARRAGVSISTVSRVLTSSPHPVSAATRDRVLAAASELDYYPDAAARSLKSRRSGIVGVIVHDISLPGSGGLVRGVEEIALANGSLVMVCSGDSVLERELAAIRALRGLRADGLILAGRGVLDEAYTRELAAQAAAVMAQRQVVVSTLDQLGGVPQVRCDQIEVGRLAASYLCRRGHRRIAVAAGLAHERTTAERLAGYAETLAAAGVGFDPGLVVYGKGGAAAEAGREAAELLLERGELFTAVFAAGEGMDGGVLQALTSQGIRVPEEVSVIGVSADGDGGSSSGAGLTTVDLPARELGRRAMQTVLELADPDLSDEAFAAGRSREHVLLPQLIERGSVRSLAGLARR